MAEPALRSVERLRKAHVEQQSRALASALVRFEQARAAHREALQKQQAVQRTLERARTAFSLADSVSALRACGSWLEAARAELAQTSARVALTSAACAREEALVEACRAALGEAERARLVVSRALEARDRDVSLRTERREEELLDDAYRTRPVR
jgi:hypothetical protein